jgi:hypothetical protein
MLAVGAQGADAITAPAARQEGQVLTAQELLAGSLLVHDVAVPASVLRPGGEAGQGVGGKVRLRPLKVVALALIAKASQEDPSLVPLLMIKESLVEPVLPLEQIRQMHAGLVHFLVVAINRISGLDSGEGAAHRASASAIGEAHLQLARHFGWTPAQVAELTPGQVAVYLAGIERLLALDAQRKPER